MTHNRKKEHDFLAELLIALLHDQACLGTVRSPVANSISALAPKSPDPLMAVLRSLELPSGFPTLPGGSDRTGLHRHRVHLDGCNNTGYRVMRMGRLEVRALGDPLIDV